MDRGNATDARIFSVGTQFLFSGAGDAMQKKESGQVESLVPEVPMHVNVEAALTEFLTCHPWRCEHHFAKLDCTFPPCQSNGSGQFDTQE